MKTPVAERGLGRGDPRVRARRASPWCSARGAGSGAGAWCGPPLGRAPIAAGGDSLVAHHGVVGPGTDMSPDTRPACDCSRRRRDRRSRRPARRWHSYDGPVVQRPPAGTIPDAPGLLPVQGRARAGSSTSARRSRCASGCRNYFADPAACRRAPRRWWRRPRPSSGSRSATTSRRSCSSTASSSSTGPASTSGCATTRATRSWPSPSTTSGPGPMVMRGAQAQGRPLLRALRPRLRHPRDARPAAAHVPDPHLLATTSSTATSGWAGRACSSTSRSARARASARSTSRAYDELVDELLDFLDGDTDPIVQAARDARCARRPTRSSSSGRPGCATGWPAVRKAIEKQQMVADRNEDLDVIGIADDELEAAVQVFFVRKGRVVGRKGFVSTRSRTSRRPSSSATSSRASTTTSRRSACPSRCSCPSSPTTPTSTRSG